MVVVVVVVVGRLGRWFGEWFGGRRRRGCWWIGGSGDVVVWGKVVRL